MKKKIVFIIAFYLCLSNTVILAQDWTITGNKLDGNGKIGSINFKNINFISDNKTRGRLSDGGLWGFGTTVPLAQVHINANDSARNPLQIDVLDSAKIVVNNNGGISIGNNKVAPANGLYVSGKLGIGTNVPDVNLHVVGGKEVSLSNGGTFMIGFATSHNLAMDNNEIQARDNGAAGILHLNKNGGDININSGGMLFQSSTNRLGIGTTLPDVPLSIEGGTPLFDIGRGGYISTGSKTAFNLVISESDIQARNNGTGSLLNLNKFGGDVNISSGALFVDGSNNFVGIGAIPSARLHVVLGTEASLTDGGYIVAGPTTFKNVVIDADEIQARNNGSADILNLNPHGGTVYVSKGLQIGSLYLTEEMIDFGVGRGPGFRLDAGSNSIKISGNFRPYDDNLWTLGSSSKRWTEVWSVDGSINTSDARDKKNIRDLDYGLKEIMKLRSVKFNWKDEHNTDDKIGLVAQDLQKVLPEVVRSYEYKTDSITGKKEKASSARLGVMYADLIPVLINAIQQQQKEIEELKKIVNDNVSTNIQRSPASVSAARLQPANTVLEQNFPNPFANTTSIKYVVSNAKKAYITIRDINGKVVKQITLNKTSGVVNFSAVGLSAGIYTYTLFIDDNATETKRMIVSG